RAATRLQVEALVSQFPPRRYPELSKDVTEMPLDGTRAEEQLAADLPIRETTLHQTRDLQLLAGELRRGCIDGPASSSARSRCELAASALRERFDPHALQLFVRDVELIASLASAALTT